MCRYLFCFLTVVYFSCLVTFGSATHPSVRALQELDVRTPEASWQLTLFNRVLAKEGFHRELITNISLHAYPTPNYKTQSCTLVIAELIDVAFYVDKFQVEEIWRLGKDISLVHFFDEFDLEKASSHPDIIAKGTIPVLIVLPPVTVPEFPRVINFASSLPIHARYQIPSEKDTHRALTIKSPLTFISCEELKEGERSAHTKKKGASSSSASASSSRHQQRRSLASFLSLLNSKATTPDTFKTWRGIRLHEKELEWKVPIGLLEDKAFVMAVTLGSTSAASFLVLFFLCRGVSPSSVAGEGQPRGGTGRRIRPKTQNR